MTRITDDADLKRIARMITDDTDLEMITQIQNGPADSLDEVIRGHPFKSVKSVF
jgi:hypothetical protein